MDDLIRRSDVIQAFDELLKSPYASNKRPFGCGVRDALKLARDMMRSDAPKSLSIPAVDAVEVVRCADCKYLNEDLAVGGWDGSCRFWNTHSVTYSWFCSQGQRREDGDGDYNVERLPLGTAFADDEPLAAAEDVLGAEE